MNIKEISGYIFSPRLLEREFAIVDANFLCYDEPTGKIVFSCVEGLRLLKKQWAHWKEGNRTCTRCIKEYDALIKKIEKLIAEKLYACIRLGWFSEDHKRQYLTLLCSYEGVNNFFKPIIFQQFL